MRLQTQQLSFLLKHITKTYPLKSPEDPIYKINILLQDQNPFESTTGAARLLCFDL